MAGGFALLVIIGTAVFITMLSVHTGDSVAAHSKTIESQYEVADPLTQEESDNLNVATCDNFLAADPKISACNAVMVTELAEADKRRRRLPEVTTTITLYFEAGNEVSAADLGALVEDAITEAAAEVIPDNAVTGITYTVSELTEVDEEDIPECANVNDGCGETTEAGSTGCAGGEYWNGDECTECPEYTYTEPGVYASASGASDDSGCKSCPEDTDLYSRFDDWLDDNLDWGEYWTLFGPDGSGMFYFPTVDMYSPAGSEGADSCITHCLYGQYWNGSECIDCPPGTLSSYTFLETDGYEENVWNDLSDPQPALALGEGNNVCVPCPDGMISGPGWLFCLWEVAG